MKRLYLVILSVHVDYSAFLKEKKWPSYFPLSFIGQTYLKETNSVCSEKINICATSHYHLSVKLILWKVTLYV